MANILVIGESCKDVFLYCDADRLCPDLPVPVLSIKRKNENPGMAMNVYKNIQSICEKNKYFLADSCDIKTNSNWEDIKKTRYMHDASNHMFIRVDDDHSQIPRLDVKSLNLDAYGLIAIADYNKGFLTTEDIEYICSNHKNVFIDTKKKVGAWADNAKIIKINNYELDRSENTITNVGRHKTICTKGADGCDFQDVNYPTTKVDVKDSCGAGDAFFAGLIYRYSKTNDIVQAIEYANKCATKVVAERGVTTIK